MLDVLESVYLTMFSSPTLFYENKICILWSDNLLLITYIYLLKEVIGPGKRVAYQLKILTSV